MVESPIVRLGAMLGRKPRALPGGQRPPRWGLSGQLVTIGLITLALFGLALVVILVALGNRANDQVQAEAEELRRALLLETEEDRIAAAEVLAHAVADEAQSIADLGETIAGIIEGARLDGPAPPGWVREPGWVPGDVEIPSPVALTQVSRLLAAHGFPAARIAVNVTGGPSWMTEGPAGLGHPTGLPAGRPLGEPTWWAVPGEDRTDLGWAVSRRGSFGGDPVQVVVVSSAENLWQRATSRLALSEAEAAIIALRIVDGSGRSVFQTPAVATMATPGVAAPVRGTPWTLRVDPRTSPAAPAVERRRNAAAARILDQTPTRIDHRIAELRDAGIAAVVIVALLLGAALAVLFAVRLRVPLSHLMEDLGLIAAGNLDHQVVVRWDDELGYLGTRINDLCSQLKRSRDRLREYNRGLERDVEERTEELAKRNLELSRLNREVEAAYYTLQTTQAQMMQQERMATLGQLLAGIAHEINNPLNFMVNAIPPLERNVRKLHDLIELYARLEGAPAKDVVRGLAEAVAWKREMDVGDVLTDIDDSVSLIQSGADRTTRIVQNLRMFSRTTPGENRDVDLSAGIDITLSLLSHLTKGRIAVVRDYHDAPGVECSPGEINQVFMNLLSNACQAIPDKGTIWITVRPDGDGVLVDVRDSGTGIPANVIPRIFEPFFTTKGAEQGTGLGLSISYSIIQKHHGRIDVASVVDEGTEFSVWLPTRRPRRTDEEGSQRSAAAVTGSTRALR